MNKNNFNKPIKKLPLALYRLARRVWLYSYPNYQPILERGKMIAGGDRNCEDRWQLIKKELIDSGSQNLLDIGCAEGYYVTRAAQECGLLALGIDPDARRLFLAQGQLINEKIFGAGFILADVNLANVDQLPCFDTVICLSVLHHLMCAHGIGWCRNFLIALKRKINKVMIFEMGQSNETTNNWAELLPDMGTEPHIWIRDFLLSAGYAKVIKIGESDSYGKDQSRAIFRVEP